ncbi:hypothetical protein [Demequina sp. NBRC 110054]|uniref:hypothetical protein n=1 Tax=Demequina sp. NBRC 110054 TaxID=1570343 RepID=UPI0009FE924A|nr:hypothetical protein [Demequina sp. NBRC 110054]
MEIGLDGKPYVPWEGPTKPPAGGSGWDDGWDQGGAALTSFVVSSAPDSSGAAGHPGTAGIPDPSSAPGYPGVLPALEPVRSVSNELNHLGWYSVGLGVAAAVVTAVGLFLGAMLMPLGVAILMAGWGFVYGVRSHNAAVRGYATNPWVGRVGILLAVAGALATVVGWFLQYVAVAEILETAAT